MVDKAITMDSLRLLCLMVNVCRGTARRPLYKFLPASQIQDLMRSTCLAIVFNKIHMSSLLVPKSVTLNDLELRNGPYFALFHRIRLRCRRKTIFRFTSVSQYTFDNL